MARILKIEKYKIGASLKFDWESKINCLKTFTFYIMMAFVTQCQTDTMIQILFLIALFVQVREVMNEEILVQFNVS